MASSTARPEPRIETMTPARITALHTACATVQAEGKKVTAAEVHRRVRGHRRAVQVYVKWWNEEHAASPVVPSPVAPPPPRVPAVPELEVLAQLVAAHEETQRRLERETQQNDASLAQHRANHRNALVEAPQLARRYLQGYQARTHPTYLMDPDMPLRLAQLRLALVALVGEAAAARLETDPSYRPSWLER